jgi:non-specific serine/threonine protein kinase
MDHPTFAYRFGTAEFDESRFELRVAGLPVDTERRALEVLAYLLRHSGEVVTKDELFREVWAGRMTVEKVLPNAIVKLRRALGEANAAHVTTVARLGYRLDGSVTRTAVGRRAASELALAAGDAIPGRPHFLARRQLGRSGGSEVWLAEQPKTRDQRVYKFALDGDRLRALKREATLLRLLQESLADTSHIVDILDWNFEQAPYFLECRYGGPSLNEWGPENFGVMDTPARIALFLQIADAVAAAHAVGVLHKDLKPANVLVAGDATRPHVRLTDFGSGHMLEPDRLERLGITRMGMTVDDRDGAESCAGTPLYIAPEHFEGQAPTVKSDVFALGVLLYQLLTGRLGQPMASSWEAEIHDELLRDDIRGATNGDPNRRLASAAEMAQRLRSLESRRAERAEWARAQEAARQDRQSLERTAARRPYMRALVALLAAGAVGAIWLQQRTASARDEAQLERDRAAALANFMNEDLIARSNPLVWAKGSEATLREVLLSARDRLPARFGAQPEVAATIHSNLSTLFGAIDLFSEAEDQARRALEIAQSNLESSPAAVFEAHAVLARVLSRTSRHAEAQAQIDAMQALLSKAPAVLAQHTISLARSQLHMARAEYGDAVVELERAIDLLPTDRPGAIALRDALRVDLILALTMANKDEQAKVEGARLIEEARSRPGNGALLAALTKVSLVRAQGEDHAAAQRLLLEAQPVVVAALGESHSRHLSLLGELLGVAFRRADWPRAIALAQQVHERIRAKYGVDHVLTYVTLVNWARALSEMGRMADALPKAREAHRQLVRIAGMKAPQTQDAAFVLALVELEAGELPRAQAAIEQLDVEVLERYRSTGTWPTAIGLLRGTLLQRRGDYHAARPLLDAGLQALKEEESLAQPGRAYLVAKRARATMP